MATHKSSEKRARQTIRKNAVNRSRRASIHTAIKAIETALTAKDAKAVDTARREAESALARGVRAGTLHWKTASRKASRLAKRAKLAAKK
jgi:small subunit ribosomal protein S20